MIGETVHADFSSSPHTRGCFPLYEGVRQRLQVFPAYAGVFLPCAGSVSCAGGLPRIRGGVSRRVQKRQSAQRSSPHTRGCFCRCARPRAQEPVFPAYAGVFPTALYRFGSRPGLPRIRGGVSEEIRTLTDYAGSSPHTRGCFFRLCVVIGVDPVFPAYAGVFLLPMWLTSRHRSLPRIRGGVSTACGRGSRWIRSSPHTRGVSVEPLRLAHGVASSPHTRGCFRNRIEALIRDLVFPAYAGVFLKEYK